MVSKNLHNGSYYLIDIREHKDSRTSEEETNMPWNIAHLRPYYTRAIGSIYVHIMTVYILSLYNKTGASAKAGSLFFFTSCVVPWGLLLTKRSSINPAYKATQIKREITRGLRCIYTIATPFDRLKAKRKLCGTKESLLHKAQLKHRSPLSIAQIVLGGSLLLKEQTSLHPCNRLSSQAWKPGVYT